jgi:hypothetical protein
MCIYRDRQPHDLSFCIPVFFSASLSISHVISGGRRQKQSVVEMVSVETKKNNNNKEKKIVVAVHCLEMTHDNRHDISVAAAHNL